MSAKALPAAPAAMKAPAVAKVQAVATAPALPAAPAETVVPVTLPVSRDSKVWTVLAVTRESGRYLERQGVEQGRLNAEHLLAKVLGVGRLELYLQFDRPLSPEELVAYKALLRRRAAREPLQYILGGVPFRGLTLKVDRRVLIPRPETEYFLDALVSVAGKDRVFASALDIGTGSGAIALALAAEGLSRSVTATDISRPALAVARRNAGALADRATVDFRAGSLLSPVAGETFDLVLSNPPYLSRAEWQETEPEVRDWEPRQALASGDDGLDVIRQLIPPAVSALRPDGWIGIETGCTQTNTVAGFFHATGRVDSVKVIEDLNGRPRYVFAHRAAGIPARGRS